MSSVSPHSMPPPGPPCLSVNDMAMFDLAPVSLWLEDYSAVRRQLEQWAAEGMTDVRQWLAARPSRTLRLAASIRLVRINARALALYGAENIEDLNSNFGYVFCDESIPSLIDEFDALWRGEKTISSISVNRTLAGDKIDIALNGVLLQGAEHDWSRILFAIRDITARQDAIRALARSEARARALFDHSPTAMLLLDLSAVRDRLVRLVYDGVCDLDGYLGKHPEFLHTLISQARILDVNESALALFAVPDIETLQASLPRLFNATSLPPMRAQIVALWNKTAPDGEAEVHNVAADGRDIWAQVRIRNLSGQDSDWSEMLVGMNDITVRRQAESYLAYLSYHDVLTGLNNRVFHMERLERLKQDGPWPVSVLMIDLNDLKGVNDRFGHAAGDALLRRAAHALSATIMPPGTASRIGGDEFAVLLPGTGEEQAAAVIHALEEAADRLAAEPGQPVLHLSIGAATATQGELAAAAELADQRMYEAKRHYYRTHDRRRRDNSGYGTPD